MGILNTEIKMYEIKACHSSTVDWEMFEKSFNTPMVGERLILMVIYDITLGKVSKHCFIYTVFLSLVTW